MSKIIIEEGLSLYKKTGIGQYSQNLYNILCDMGYDVEMNRKPFLEKIKNSTIKRILYILWINLVFPFLIMFKNTDKIMFTNTLTPLYRLPNKNYYPVLHDLWSFKSPETVTKVQSLYLNFVMFSIKHTYKKIITVSNRVKEEIIDFYNCSEDDVAVIYNTFSFGASPQISYTEKEQKNILDKYGIESKKYILSVATLNKRKNIPMLIDAYKSCQTDIKLVLVGQRSTAHFKENENKGIIFTGYIEDEILKVLYKHALMYVFPSLYEGFGIPIVDSQSFDIPVLCSDIPIFREIAGKGAYFCEISKNGFENGIKTLIDSKDLRVELINNGKENCSRFSQQVLIRQISEILM